MSLEQIQSETIRAPAAVLPPPILQKPTPPVPQQNERFYERSIGTADAAVAPRADVDVIAEELNKFIALLNSRVSFAIDEATDRTIIKVIDNETEEVIRQIPPEVMLKLLQRMTEIIGLLIDERA